jgi:very-short-patch-repair endonuclease
MRTSLNLTELLIWSRLRRRGIDGWKFRRQQPVGPYFADFCCPAARLIIEIDGPNHDEAQWAYDERRQAFLEAEGYRVVRISASDVTRDFEGVIHQIFAELGDRERLGFRKRRRI